MAVPNQDGTEAAAPPLQPQAPAVALRPHPETVAEALGHAAALLDHPAIKIPEEAHLAGAAAVAINADSAIGHGSAPIVRQKRALAPPTVAEKTRAKANHSYWLHLTRAPNGSIVPRASENAKMSAALSRAGYNVGNITGNEPVFKKDWAYYLAPDSPIDHKFVIRYSTLATRFVAVTKVSSRLDIQRIIHLAEHVVYGERPRPTNVNRVYVRVEIKIRLLLKLGLAPDAEPRPTEERRLFLAVRKVKDNAPDVWSMSGDISYMRANKADEEEQPGLFKKYLRDDPDRLLATLRLTTAPRTAAERRSKPTLDDAVSMAYPSASNRRLLTEMASNLTVLDANAEKIRYYTATQLAQLRLAGQAVIASYPQSVLAGRINQMVLCDAAFHGIANDNDPVSDVELRIISLAAYIQALVAGQVPAGPQPRPDQHAPATVPPPRWMLNNDPKVPTATEHSLPISHEPNSIRIGLLGNFQPL